MNPPTPHELNIFRLYLELESKDEVARKLGLSIHTIKHEIDILYGKLNVTSSLGALKVLGWVAIPGSKSVCGWVGACGRPEGHNGHHGGFRGFSQSRPKAMPARRRAIRSA